MPERPILFCFAAHNHQPVGNFESIFEEAYQRAYKPFLDVFEPHSNLRITQHFTGILLDWFERHHPDFIDRLGGLIAAGRLELLGGGYYEPILPMLPRPDAKAQIESLGDRIRSLFGKRPRGAWVAERVWEPSLAGLLAESGVDYVLLDDAHFKAVGFHDERLVGPFKTEDDGRTLAVFPINEKLRYTIPFRQVRETVDYLKGISQRTSGPCCVTVADDGEKFGIWPQTYDSVYGEGWLEEFFCALESEGDWLRTVTFSKALLEVPSQGLVYLPTASYSEMMEWSLPTLERQDLEDFRNRVDPDLKERYGRFIRGGFWRGFLCKYREAQHLHRRMLSVSEAVRALPANEPLAHEARELLGAAQCNCGYWHGVFGGIYLNHIRAANYSNLIRAHKKVREAQIQSLPVFQSRNWDFFRDGGECLEVTTPTEHLLFDLVSGGSLVEWDDLRIASNLVNTMSRRPESYHRSTDPRLGQAESGMVYDPYRRVGSIHHFFTETLSLDKFIGNPGVEDSTFPSSRFRGSFHCVEKAARIVLEGNGQVSENGTDFCFEIGQTWSRAEDKSQWTIATRIRNTGPKRWRGFYGIEFGWSLNAGNTPDRYYTIDGEKPSDPNLSSVGETHGVSTVDLVEEWWGIAIRFRFDQPARLWRFPIETVSKAVTILERVYQSSVVVPCWQLEIEPGGETAVRNSLETVVRRPLSGSGG